MSKTDKKRANSIITVSRFGNKLAFTFLGVGQFVFDPDSVSAENRARAMMHGFEQRIRDAAALSVDRDTGRSATAREKHDAARRIADHLMSGSTDWNLRAAASPGVDAGLTIQAMMRALGKDLDAVEALIAATQAKRGVERAGALKIWADAKQVAQAILDIKRERAAGGADASDLEAEMMADEPDDESPDEDDERQVEADNRAASRLAAAEAADDEALM